MKILIIGATGFIGDALACALATGPYQLRLSYHLGGHSRPSFTGENIETIAVDLAPGFDWRPVVAGCDTVIHVAGRAHVVDNPASNSIEKFRQINVAGMHDLVHCAAAAGVRRFIYISSIGVNGNIGTVPFTESDEPAPKEPYAISKLEAEQILQTLSRQCGLEIVIIRPPMVYGPGAPGNFNRLIKAVVKGWPLPLGAIHNRRSFVGVNNLTDFIMTCIHHPAAANQVFLVSDGEDLSTTQLLIRLSRALGRSVRLIPMPYALLRNLAVLVGKADLAHKLCGSLQVDISKARKLLGWEPPNSVDEELKTVAASLSEQLQSHK